MPRAAQTVEEEPAGLVYRPELISLGEQRELLAVLGSLELHEVVMRGQTAKRTVRHFGWDYDYESWKVRPSDPLPGELEPVRERCEGLAGAEPGSLVQALVSRYPPGAGIGWHRDAPLFGPAVVGVSLGSACRMRFQRTAGSVRRVWALELEPRSAYVLAGPARSAWQHSIPGAREERWSITFRSLKPGSRWRA